MAFDPGAIDSALSAAVGDAPELVAELRAAFRDSAQRQLADLLAASDVDAWRAAATRLASLAASFGAVRLLALARQAEMGDVGDRKLAATMKRTIARL